MGELLQQLAACRRQPSIDVHPFALSPVASNELPARVKALRSLMSLDFLMMDYCTDALHVLYIAPKRAYNPATNTMQEALQVSAQVGVNTARKEAENQPKTGWTVDLVAQTCPCSYHFKYGDCMYRLFAMQERARVDGNGEEVLVNRRAPKCKRTAVGTAPSLPNVVGRPPLVGHALQRE
ncbi:hypothetical protein PI124_g10618 [Phytophthora idaei]|nr:hypothetical protein PI126_g9821 [Phytophthora idaei]KAG3244600.1 hypothetical protein PI124_g10618 [Phytophthora idaei]